MVFSPSLYPLPSPEGGSPASAGRRMPRRIRFFKFWSFTLVFRSSGPDARVTYRTWSPRGTAGIEYPVLLQVTLKVPERSVRGSVRYRSAPYFKILPLLSSFPFCSRAFFFHVRLKRILYVTPFLLFGVVFLRRSPYASRCSAANR